MSFGIKEGYTKIRISAKPGLESRTLWLEGQQCQQRIPLAMTLKGLCYDFVVLDQFSLKLLLSGFTDINCEVII